MRVFKHGDGLAVCLPQSVIAELGLRESDDVTVVRAEKGVIEIDSKEARRRLAIDSLASRNWTLPPDYKFGREEANARSSHSPDSPLGPNPTK
ncbi:AbrB/MazE/SpoVT family DNA-binding domain-containing protein [Bradyrhizobium sp. HKCCYLRH3099]|uniref:AbrB/MazE/SpoVT family DNA-binding domain-containing protein n=1 Tax=unclassified Bradyrhizobium TaxID=2631580 RepID=UPI003EB8EEF5